MNTHADKIQKNNSQSASAASVQKQTGGESAFQFVDNRPEAFTQRKLHEMVNNSLGSVTHSGVALKHSSANQSGPVQRVVGPEPEEQFRPNLAWAQWFAAMNPEEFSAQLEKHNLKRDSAVVALMNGILIRNGLKPLTDALPDREEEQPLVIGAKKEKKEEAKVEKKEDKEQEEEHQESAVGKEKAGGKTVEVEDDPETKFIKRTTPAKLIISSGQGKKLVLELYNEFGEVIASVTTNEGTTKTIAKKLIGENTAAKKSYPIPKGNSHPEFAKTLSAFAEKAKAETHLEQLQKEGGLKKNLPSQKDLYQHLFEAMQSATGKGHASVKMAKIPLIKAVTYSAYGKDHVVTHLYTQPGNETEIRCYLGTDKGPFQRIHTSLTVLPKETPTSHTMVQTGAKLGIPPFAGTVGERVGFDAVEMKEGMGFANRHLTERSKAQCTVKGYIEGKTLAEIGVENAKIAAEMAQSFNRTLDEVSKDISNGNLGSRGVTWLSSFDPIDEGK